MRLMDILILLIRAQRACVAFFVKHPSFPSSGHTTSVLWVKRTKQTPCLNSYSSWEPMTGASQSSLSVPAIGSEISTWHLTWQWLAGRIELDQWETRRLYCKALVWVTRTHSSSFKWLWTWEAKCWKPSAATYKAVEENSWQWKQYKIKGRKGRERRQEGQRFGSCKSCGPCHVSNQIFPLDFLP